MNTKEAIKKWNAGEELESVEMGGISEGYENAIQQEIFPLCEKIIDTLILKSNNEKELDEFYKNKYDKIMHRQVKGKGLSGAQAGQIKIVAWQFAKYGYDYMMKKAPKDRIIKIKKD